MAKGFWNFLKKAHNIKKETEDKNSENYINNNPTEEQLKNNKNGTIAVILSLISCVLLIVLIAGIVLIFADNFWIGILSIILLFIPAYLQMLAIKKSKKQLNINGRGKIKFILVKYIFPILAASISLIVLFCLICR